jgi:hypothetical protein
VRVRALRGVCVGVDRHLSAGDVTDLEPATVPFLVSIKAVEVVPDDPSPAVEAHPEPKKSLGKKPGKE